MLRVKCHNQSVRHFWVEWHVAPHCIGKRKNDASLATVNYLKLFFFFFEIILSFFYSMVDAVMDFLRNLEGTRPYTKLTMILSHGKSIY
jgi:hypothetical protein